MPNRRARKWLPLQYILWECQQIQANLVVPLVALRHLHSPAGRAYTFFMPHVTEHAPGAFSWIELGTTDQNAAKHFYSSLFGWSFADSPMGPNDFYTMFSLEDENTAGAYTLRPEHIQQGIPPHWMLYIAVTSADAAVERATELGARIMGGPF